MAEVSVVRVSSKGQIVLPERFRKEMKIRQGTNMLAVKEGEVIILKKEESLKDDFKDLTKMAEVSIKDIWDDKREDIWNSYLRRKKR